MRLRVIPGGIALTIAGCGLSVMGTPSGEDAGVEAGTPPVILADAAVAPDAIADATPDAPPVTPPIDAAPDVIIAPACIPGATGPACACGASACPAGSTECKGGKCFGTLTVSVSIDGRSDLYLRGGVVTWRHDEYSAPGPTTLNGTPWTPLWPKPNPTDCECNSSNSATVTPALPARPQTVVLTKTAGRRDPDLRQPSGLNDYAAVVRIDDDTSGADNYAFTLTYETR